MCFVFMSLSGLGAVLCYVSLSALEVESLIHEFFRAAHTWSMSIPLVALRTYCAQASMDIPAPQIFPTNPKVTHD